jgi:hypothetical protein
MPRSRYGFVGDIIKLEKKSFGIEKLVIYKRLFGEINSIKLDIALWHLNIIKKSLQNFIQIFIIPINKSSLFLRIFFSLKNAHQTNQNQRSQAHR